MTNADKLAGALCALYNDIPYPETRSPNAVKARAVLAEYRALPKVFTVFIRDRVNIGTTFIGAVVADDAESAKKAAVGDCLACWGLPDTPSNRDILHVLGVAPGDINFIEWNDLES